MKRVLLTLALIAILTPFCFAAKSRTTLVTNEYAFWNPDDFRSVKSDTWNVTSGSLFLKDGKYWSGVPDDVEPNYKSSNGTDSAIFRAITKKSYSNSVSFKFQLNKLVTTPSTPAVAWDGAHAFIRYQSESSLYYASFLRRDGNIVIKKKCDGGSSNGGTYYDISNYVKKSFPKGTNTVKAVATNIDGGVKIDLYVNGKIVVSGTDKGVGCPAITDSGKMGIRGDNADFYFSNFVAN